MAFWIPMAIGAGAGLLKHELVDKPEHRRMQNAEAAKTMYSPWTGMQGKTLTNPSAFGSMLQGAALGGQIGQAMGPSIPGLGDVDQAKTVAGVQGSRIGSPRSPWLDLQGYGGQQSMIA